MINQKGEFNVPEGFQPAIAPFCHQDTESFEAYRKYATGVESELESALINTAVDAARATLEGLRFAFASPRFDARGVRQPGPYPNVIVYFSSDRQRD